MQDEVEAEVEEEDVVAAEEEGVLGDNVFQDYFQSDMELGDCFSVFNKLKCGMKFSADYQIKVKVSPVYSEQYVQFLVSIT